MKRTISFTLILVLCIGLIAGCQGTTPAATTVKPGGTTGHPTLPEHHGIGAGAGLIFRREFPQPACKSENRVYIDIRKH